MPKKKLVTTAEVPREQLEAAYLKLLITKAQMEDTPESFSCYFNVMEGVPPHKEGKRWIRNAYKAHKEGKGLLQECHRESGKTTVFSKHFIAYRIGKEPHKTNMLLRLNDAKAKETTLAIANTIDNNPLWKMIFPNVRPDKEYGWSQNGYYVVDTDIDKDEWQIRRSRSANYPTLVGYGYGSGAITGSRISGCAVVDDIHNIENTTSSRELDRVKRWYTEDFTYLLMRDCWEIWNFTPWQYNDLYSDLKANTDRYIHSRTPVMKPASQGEEGASYWEPDPRIPYSGKWWKLYWPEVWDFKRIAQKYISKPSSPDEEIMFAFERQMLCDVEITKGANLKSEWLHTFPADQIHEYWPVYFGVDYASTQDKMRDKNRDYFALAIFKAIPGGGLVLVDGYRAHLFKSEALELIMTKWGQYGELLQKIGVESIGIGKEFYNDLALLTDVYGKVPPLFEVRSFPKRSGVDSMVENWLAPRFKMSRIWVSDAPSPFITHFKNEWLMFPNHEHNDCLAAVLMASLSAEGMMPSVAERVFKKKRSPNPYAKLALVGR